MRLTTVLLFPFLTLTATAKTHRLCCCTTTDACGFLSCDGAATQAVVNTNKVRFIRSTKAWDKLNGAPCGGTKNWMYAAGGPYDDEMLGGNEVSDLCSQQGRASLCFSPDGNWRNGPMIRGRSVEVVEAAPDRSAPRAADLIARMVNGGSGGGERGSAASEHSSESTPSEHPSESPPSEHGSASSDEPPIISKVTPPGYHAPGQSDPSKKYKKPKFAGDANHWPVC
ncbi:hypothetical protein FKW77_009347 [Venturia effusa]|uniref:Uncharacterized protein n=1 Tax=Venturia effusa TaxID=50376 RepID=A0A517KX93_9PEZI|nr:hypothetical protein FKW77_009347 [Venturia effusa]